MVWGLMLPACDVNSPPDSTLSPTFTIGPTAAFTPQQPAANTVEPAVQPPQFNLEGPPGWMHFTAGEISLWLPPNWNGGDPSSELEDANPDFAQYIAAIRTNSDVFLFWGYDRNSSLDFLTDVSVVKEQLPSPVTAANYIDLMTQQQPEMYTTISTATYLMGNCQAGEIVRQFEIQGTIIKQIRFILRSELGIFMLTLTTQLSEFDQRIETFRLIFELFEVAPGL